VSLVPRPRAPLRATLCPTGCAGLSVGRLGPRLTAVAFRTRSDDLIPEENEVVQQALKRLSPQQSYDRVYRLRRAAQLSLQHKLLPKGQWTQPSQDVLYLEPLIDQIKAELAEKKQLDAMEVVKKH